MKEDVFMHMYQSMRFKANEGLKVFQVIATRNLNRLASREPPLDTALIT